MQTYLVGGAVRDKLLGLPIREQDYVVVGSTPQAMTSLGFKPVGRDFPVFLHPKTHEEYALARTERKTARGHQGFSFYADPKVTLEEDLIRRDLTINAMAEDDHGHIIDPYHGQQDLQDRILRHVSPAFGEDPLRILRVARFAAYLGQFDFTVALETMVLMRKMVQHHALDELSDERIWQEIYRALQTDYPEKFFAILEEIGALPSLFKPLPNSIPQEVKEPLIRFAVLCQKAQYLRPAPKEFEELAHMVHTKTPEALNFTTMSTEDQVHFLRSLDYLRRPERLEQWITASQIITASFPTQEIQYATTALRNLNREAIAKDADNIAEAIFKAECVALRANTETRQSGIIKSAPRSIPIHTQ